MKKLNALFGILVVSGLLLSSMNVNAQEEESSVWSTGLDIYSSYIWRGAKFGNGPAFQPYVDATIDGFSVGAWGSVSSSSNEGFEMDLYLGYSFDFGLSLTITDYYFGGDWTEIDMNHFIEPMAGFEAGGFSVLAAYMLLPGMEATAESEEVGYGEEGDLYLEAGYSFENVSIALGFGDGQYTFTDDDPEGGFNICNITIGTSKEIPITEKFSLPVSGSVTFNPTTGGFFITAGVSL